MFFTWSHLLVSSIGVYSIGVYFFSYDAWWKMKFILLSDIHASSKNPVGRKDNIFKAFLNKIDFVFEHISEKVKGHCVILQSGDFFDRPRDWKVLLAMFELLQSHDISIYTIIGQHDSYMRSDIYETPTTLGILQRARLLSILGPKPVIFTETYYKRQQIYVYGCGWKQKVPKPKGDINILVIHAPISESSLFPGHDYIDTFDFAKENKGYDLILAGDIHRLFVYLHKNGRTQIVNTGPMMRRESTDYNMTHKPCFFIWDSKNFSLEKIQIPHKSSKEVLSKIHIKDKTREELVKKFESIANEFVIPQEEDDYEIRDQILKEIKIYKAFGNKFSKRTEAIISNALTEVDNGS